MRRLLLLFALAACSSRPPALHADPQALAYRSRAPVADAVAKQIGAEAVGAARRRPAWNESLHVHGSDGPIGDGVEKYLFGEVRLFLIEYESDPGKFREVDPHDDALVAAADAQFAFSELQRWAREHAVSWDVQLGRLTGRVDASGPDDGAKKIAAELQRRAAPLPASLDAERARLDLKYRDRR